MADPITPNTPDVDGQVVMMPAAHTSTGGAKEESQDLPTYAPLIDIRIGHPVLAMTLISTETVVTDSEDYPSNKEMARGVAADGANEWRVVDENTVALYTANDKNGILFITYIAFGSQQA